MQVTTEESAKITANAVRAMHGPLSRKLDDVFAQQLSTAYWFERASLPREGDVFTTIDGKCRITVTAVDAKIVHYDYESPDSWKQTSTRKQSLSRLDFRQMAAKTIAAGHSFTPNDNALPPEVEA